jgi:alkylated DNA repair protein alkB family protein 1
MFGLASVFLIGGTDRESVPTGLVLRSGDVVVMAEPRCRRAYHGVPRILEGSLPAHLKENAVLNTPDDDHYVEDWQPYGEYLEGARINVNVRQVFPRGFDPQRHDSSASV